MKMRILISAFFLMVASGCSSTSQASSPTESSQYPVQMTLTLTERSMTSTPALVSPTETDIPIRSCENDGFSVESPEDLNASGEVLLLPSDQNRLNALNLETQAVSTIYYDENSKLSIFGSSPNSDWLAYAILSYGPDSNINSKFKMQLLSQTGERVDREMSVSQFEPLFKGDVFVGFGYSYWITNELIYTTLLKQNPYEGSKTYGSIPVILNPFTGSWEENLLALQSERIAGTEIGFSPDLKSVVLQDQQAIRLKDLKNGKYLWSTGEFFLGVPDSKIRWAPNGEFVAIGERFQDPKILLVTVDGKKLEIITVENENSGGSLNFEWSPNSQFLMLYYSYGDKQKQFYLYDVAKHQIVLKCPIQQPWDILFQWSPDSSKVIYGTYEGYLQVLDISSGKVARLDAEDVLPFSWTNEPFPH